MFEILTIPCPLPRVAAQKFSFGDHSPGSLGDGSPAMGKDLGNFVPQKLEPFAYII